MCMILTTVAEWATDTFLLQPETVFYGDPKIPGKWDHKVPDSFRKTLFAKTVNLSAKTATHSARTVTHFARPVT